MGGRTVSPVLLWLGILGGPVAFGLTRLAGLVLLSRCIRPGVPTFLGLSSSQWLMVGITVVCALIAALSWVLSRTILARTGRPWEEQTVEHIGSAAFFALGGVFLSGVFFVVVVLVGALAIGLSTTCPP